MFFQLKIIRNLMSKLVVFVLILFSSIPSYAKDICDEKSALNRFLEISKFVNNGDKTAIEKLIEKNFILESFAFTPSKMIDDLYDQILDIKSIELYRARCRGPNVIILDFVINDIDVDYTRYSISMGKVDGEWLYRYSQKVERSLDKIFDDFYEVSYLVFQYEYGE